MGVILYDFWLIIAIAGVAISLFGIYRLLDDELRADKSDVFTFLFGFILMLISAITASSLDFITCTGTVCASYTYQGMALFGYPLFAFAILDVALMFIAILKTIDIRKAKERFIEYQ
jgi:hypothetical protein